MTENGKSAPVILLVDDEDVIRTMGRDILRVLGYEVLLASNGDETIKMVKNNRDKIALVLLDWHMPGMSGSEILEELWKIDEGIKVIISTGWGAPREMEQILKSGRRIGLLQKPYLVKDLQDEISKFIQQ